MNPKVGPIIHIRTMQFHTDTLQVEIIWEVLCNLNQTMLDRLTLILQGQVSIFLAVCTPSPDKCYTANSSSN